jgi:D-3-phosphoglycerate dehydrogenase
MKNSAVLINTARGALIDHDALLKALQENRIRMAALDVFGYEPLYKGDPLLDLPNLIYTPHIGGASEDVVRHHSRMAYESLNDFVRSVTPVKYLWGKSV